jgi:AcrR family transcriptional regulator
LTTNVATARLARTDRRDALLDAAATMVSAGEIDHVSMEEVAERAGVSRALVYKHFANRSDLVAALFERESAHLHARLAADVAQAVSLEQMLRALIRGALHAQAERGATFAALVSSGGGRGHRSVQARRDGQTLRSFARRAMAEFGTDEATATVALAISLGSIGTVLARWRSHPTPAHAQQLEDAFVAMAVGGLGELRRGRNR